MTSQRRARSSSASSGGRRLGGQNSGPRRNRSRRPLAAEFLGPTSWQLSINASIRRFRLVAATLTNGP
ncbi:MAG: hypothetical protein AW07_03635 [Candidatus Accumulibacter sp. SK-11]|nr:MAG: hypothetical protein AW07_03635 [Candidatus Accumulibacter sp. SK-11]